MSLQLNELEAVLRQMLQEHQKLLKHVEAHADAMRHLDLKAMDDSARQQEALRLRIMGLENKRRAIVLGLARLNKADHFLSVSQVAKLYPQRQAALLKLRDELMALISQIGNRLYVAGKLAGALLGHMNTVVRIVAAAVEGAGLYTKSGVPKVAARIGAMNALG